MNQPTYEQLLGAEVARRDATDYRFNWGTYFGWTFLSAGVYSHYATYRLVQRRDEHAKRRLAFQSYLWHLLNARAEAAGRRAEVAEGLDNLSRIHSQIEAFERVNRREPILWLLLRIVLSPVGGYINHFLNRDLRFYDEWESAFFANVEWIMQRLGIPVSVPRRTTPVPLRTTLGYVILTIASIGLFSIYWRYTVMTDGNAHFDDDAAAEDAILRALGITPPPPGLGTMPPAPPPPAR